MNAYGIIRTKARMSQADLAEKLQVPTYYISRIERAENPVPTLHYYENFKRVFNVTDEDIKAVRAIE
ncbi:helix-turn-helix domain-containing protein [Candidatus Enterococcus clewellii]|uniref:HTH cro/C1-type domain-containing protein n=1 Tax=Candidatus Enterococcus clewellii TaxID=1834193 RepID=A0A242K3D0_9ENTE|nr:helix-turn-helix transcriptional regulator [Enterococcus sp. 9E7_DIV0242]OTP13411.1 hypothetical protein A5888_002889 [Enterococcus sp. 9E7_DIV0242]